MTRKPKPEVDWSVTTWKGSRLQQHREFQALPFARKLEVMDDLQASVDSFKLAPAAKKPAQPAKY
jgi:hypothetical protein